MQKSEKNGRSERSRPRQILRRADTQQWPAQCGLICPSTDHEEAAIAQLFLEIRHQLTGPLHADEPVFDFAFDVGIVGPTPRHDQYGSLSRRPNSSIADSSTMLRSACAVPSVRWNCAEVDADLADRRLRIERVALLGNHHDIFRRHAASSARLLFAQCPRPVRAR